eukprot:g1445.t1
MTSSKSTRSKVQEMLEERLQSPSVSAQGGNCPSSPDSFPKVLPNEAVEIESLVAPNNITQPEKGHIELEKIERKQLPDTVNAPALSLTRLFMMFLSFGYRAFGGPAAQIAMLKDELVIRDKWISLERFNRVMAVYQIIPGPEAMELCCYFGYLARGPIGGFIGGMGFIIPGFSLMLFFSYIYVHFGLDNEYFYASFRGIQPAVAAMLVRAVFKLGDHATLNATTHKRDWWLVGIACGAAVFDVLRINFLITLTLSGIVYNLVHVKFFKCVVLVIILSGVGYGLGVAYVGMPTPVSVGTGVVEEVTPLSLWLLGLLGGALTFGGAYTAIPFMQIEATVLASWMTKTQFLDGIALAICLPAPLVIFSTFVGYVLGTQLHMGKNNVGGEVLGAFLTTCGMFTPAFTFTILGHNVLDRLIDFAPLQTFLYGMASCVIGLVATSAMSFTAISCKQSPLSAIIFLCSLYVLFTIKHKYVNFALVFAVALVGQYFFAPTY